MPRRQRYMDFNLLADKVTLNEVEEKLTEHLAYWKKQLEDAPAALELPTDRSLAAVSTFASARRTIVLPSALSDPLEQLSRQEGASLFMTLLAAFETLLYRYSGQSDMLVGTPVVESTGAERTGGMNGFVNFLVLRTDLS